MRYVGIPCRVDVKSLEEERGLRKEEDYVSNIAQPGSKGHRPLLKLSFSLMRMQLKNKRLQNVQRSLTLSCPYLWCWLSPPVQTVTLVDQCWKANSWIHCVSLWTESTKNGRSHTRKLQQATSYGHMQLVSATIKPSSHQENNAFGTELCFQPWHVFRALWRLVLKG